MYIYIHETRKNICIDYIHEITHAYIYIYVRPK